jgi:hypothetical protein
VNSEWYNAVFEEYRSLRAEAVSARDAQLSILALAIPLLAALLGLGVSLREESFLGGFLLSIIVPVVVFITFELLIGEIRRSIRAGAVVAAIEGRLGDVLGEPGVGPPMGWERWLRRPLSGGSWPYREKASQQKRDSVVRALVISLLLFFIAGGGYGLGLHFLWHYGYGTTAGIVAAAVGALLIVLVVRIAYAVRDLESRDAPPSAADVWPNATPAETASAG